MCEKCRLPILIDGVKLAACVVVGQEIVRILTLMLTKEGGEVLLSTHGWGNTQIGKYPCGCLTGYMSCCLYRSR